MDPAGLLLILIFIAIVTYPITEEKKKKKAQNSDWQQAFTVPQQITVDRLRALHHLDFEFLVGEVFEDEGYTVHMTGAGADGGKDLVAVKDGKLVYIECKQSIHPFDVAAMRSFDSVVRRDKASEGWVVALAGFTRPAIEHARRGRKLKVINGEELVKLLKEKGLNP